MHDIRFIRENPEAFDAALARRGPKVVADALASVKEILDNTQINSIAEGLIALDEERRALTTRLQFAQSQRNEISKKIGGAVARKDFSEVERLKDELKAFANEQPVIQQNAEIQRKLYDLLSAIPNLPADEVLDGAGEEGNRVEKEWGTPRAFDFTPREHWDIGPALGLDFETGARLSGARFTFLRGDMARMHRALGQFMLDVQTREHGYEECNPPVLVGDDAMYGTDKLPKFAEDSFDTRLRVDEASLWEDVQTKFRLMKAPEIIAKAEAEGSIGQLQKQTFDFFLQAIQQSPLNRRWLIPTSEVSLTASVMGELLDETALPMRLTALTLCFRSEAGAAGRDTRGFIRQHQFEKCELVSIVRPEDSEAEHDRMTRAAETILERLNLPYRKLLLCTGDMGFGARKTYDLEVWLPGQGAYREISSCSNTGDFQARRMNTRYRVAGEQKTTQFVHTLNGSGLAVGRTLVAVIENYQNADGSVTVPDALLPYMGGVTRLEPKP